jgi:NAD(P)-dependent dehydrogenase (short-subunit alcohol dehydrogenase family)
MAIDFWGLRGRSILITGAARGIGAESARRLAARGAKVSLVGLEPDELERVARQCGPEAAWFEADITDPDQLERAVEGTLERFGGLEVLIANAGIAPAGFVRSIDPAAFEAAIKVNLLGTWRTVRACLPNLIERRGYVLVVASLSAAFHAPGMAAYSASKAGVEALTNSLREEVRHLAVDAGCAYFGFIDTDMVRGADAHPLYSGLRMRLPAPLRRLHPVSAAGEAVADGVEQRRRWIVVPGWMRLLLLMRGPLQRLPLTRTAIVQELDASFARDIEDRGVEEASAPVGAGGAAARERVVNRT